MSDGQSGDGRPEIPSRQRRLVAFLRHNQDQLITDAAILLAWIVGTGVVFGLLGIPDWLRYLVLFGGIVLYARITPTWERPYQSPD